MAKPLHVLVTAGPTREYLDPVRFISNPSTGKMGYACARAALRRGHRVTLISGPTVLRPPVGAKVIHVETGEQMWQAVRKTYPHCDAVIMTAAVGDFKPRRRSKTKISKTQSGRSGLILHLIPARDILAKLGRHKKHQTLIGFAVQDRCARTRALAKLKAKNLDAIILNSPAAFAADRTTAGIFTDDGWTAYKDVAKTTLATRIIHLAETLCQQKQ
ncbi:MAG: phosphopantothenoylcysteine decarboxylase [Sedimentisphaerales bacterium]|nr:phosphopantothenoylcysteine decarboxylase [Sedimentisphaerales bacterium]